MTATSKRAEAASLKAYPPTYTTVKRHAKRVQSELVDTHKPVRAIFQQGYEQAEKDLALTWEDMVLLRTLFDATDANQSMGALTVQPMTREYYEYLLREFNEQRKK